MTTPGSEGDHEAVARAFSGHRFTETFDRIAEHATWDIVGERRIEGRGPIVEACEGTQRDLADVETTWIRFVSTGEGDVVAVDVVARYTGPSGDFTVASCDVYEFADGMVVGIRSYTVEA